MLQVLTLMSKIVFAPVWLLWKGYNVLWWAFEGFGRREQPADSVSTPERGAAFEITDSRPAEIVLTPPTGLLKGGFIGTMLLSAGAGVASGALASSQTLSSTHAWLVWGWATVIASLVSIFAVRKVAMERARRKTVRDRIRSAVNRAGRGAANVAAAGFAAAKHAAGVETSAPTQQAPAAAASGTPTNARAKAVWAGHMVGKGAAAAGQCTAAGCKAAWAGVCHAAATYKEMRSPSAARTPATGV
jgi:hypothetical protein